MIGPRRWRSDRPAPAQHVTLRPPIRRPRSGRPTWPICRPPSALRTPFSSVSFWKKPSVCSVCSVGRPPSFVFYAMVPWTPLRFGTARLLLPLGPRSVASVTKSDFLRLLRLFAANPLPPAERPAHLAVRPPPSAVRTPPRRRSHHRQIAPHRRLQAREPILHDRRSRPFHQQPLGPWSGIAPRIRPVGPTGRSTSAAVAGAVVRSSPGRWAVARAGFRADR